VAAVHLLVLADCCRGNASCIGDSCWNLGAMTSSAVGLVLCLAQNGRLVQFRNSYLCFISHSLIIKTRSSAVAEIAVRTFRLFGGFEAASDEPDANVSDEDAPSLLHSFFVLLLKFIQLFGYPAASE